MSSSDHLAELSQDKFIRERIKPRQGDFYYLHLSDLLLALSRHSTQEQIRVLDFGCGGSPYRSLFPNADYFRADVNGAQNIDFEISETGKTNAPSNSADLILSTQVLEHCASPRIYLQECHRVVRKPGKLLLVTHGLFEEHSCPFDFFRWTEDGLRTLLEECDFKVESIDRVTMGPRAGFQLLQSAMSQSNLMGRSSLSRIVLWPISRLLLARRRLWDPLLDSMFSEYRLSGTQRIPGDNFYVSLLAVANPL